MASMVVRIDTTVLCAPLVGWNEPAEWSKPAPASVTRLNVLYVTAMDLAPWEHPEHVDTAWVEAGEAWYVLGSDKRGGMGAPEAIPFSRQPAAEAFAVTHGGEVVAFDGVPESYIPGHGQRSP